MKSKEALANTILRPWQEAVGTLDGIETSSENVVILISMRRQVSLEIPPNELKECKENLEKLVGGRISILRTDKGYIMNRFSSDDDAVITVPQRRG